MKRLVLSAFAATLMTSAAFAQTKEVNVTFVTASDMDTMSGKKRGGVARLAAVVKAERAANPNAVFVYPGDLLSPSILGGFDKGAHMIELLNMTPPDMLAPGNHEYDYGQEIFIKRMQEGKFVKLGTNTRLDGKPIGDFKDTVIKEFNGVKVGFMGLTTQDTKFISSPGKVEFLDTVGTAKATAATLRDQGVDMVVSVVHTAQEVDFDLLYTAGVDVVLSGHDHNLHIFYDGRRALVESKEEAEYVVSMDVTFTVTEKDGKRRVRWWPNYRIIDTATVTPDPAVEAKVAAYEATLSKELDVEIGKTDIELDTRKASVRTGEAVFGNLVVDGMRKAVDADIALTNGGGIRGNKVYEPGSVLTRRDVLTELPFGNGTVKLEMSGADVKAALEHSVSKAPKAAGHFLHVSGMTMLVDLSKEPGNRVESVLVDGVPLDPAKTYTVATNDFMARGGDGYKMMKGAKNLIDASSSVLMANHVMAHIRSLGTVSTGLENRIKIK